MFHFHLGDQQNLDLSYPLNILQLDSSARHGIARQDAHGSQTRAMTQLFTQQWLKQRPSDHVAYRDVGKHAPNAIDQAWLEAVFDPSTSQAEREASLATSNQLIQELQHADVLVIGAPMYNYGPSAALKAWIDNVVRLGKTFTMQEVDGVLQPVGLLNDKPRIAIILSSHGVAGYAPEQALAHLNHLHGQIIAALNLIGMTDIYCIGLEYEEIGGALFEQSILDAQSAIKHLVKQLMHEIVLV